MGVGKAGKSTLGMIAEIGDGSGSRPNGYLTDPAGTNRKHW